MDFNGDGIGDLIFGNADGEVLFYSRKANGDLHFEEKLKANNSTIDYNSVSSVAIVDWNNDGLFDLVISSKGIFQSWNGMSYSPTPVRLYINEGTKEQYRFGSYENIELDGSDEGFRPYCHVHVADLNGDGKKDLLVSGRHSYDDDGWNAFYFENIGTDAAPAFGNFKRLTTEGEVITGYFGPTMTVVDWNNDGALDLLFGMTNKDYHVKIYLGEPQTVIVDNNSEKNARSTIMRAYECDNTFITQISLNEATHIRLQVVGINGKILKSIDYGIVSAGKHRFDIGHSGLGSGVYYINCHLNKNQFKRERVVLTR